MSSKPCYSHLKGKRCEDTSVIDYELIDQDARVSAGKNHEMSQVGQTYGDIQSTISVRIRSIYEDRCLYFRWYCLAMFACSQGICYLQSW